MSLLRRVYAFILVSLLLVAVSACGTATESDSAATSTATRTAAASAPTADQASPSPSATPLMHIPQDEKFASFAHAQQAAPFKLVMPGWTPPSIHYQWTELSYKGRYLVNGTPTLVGQLNYATLYFVPKDHNTDGKYGVQLSETPLFIERSPLSTSDLSTPSTVKINGKSITTMTRPSPPPLTIYTWTANNLRFTLTAELDGPLTKQAVEHMVGSLLQSFR